MEEKYIKHRFILRLTENGTWVRIDVTIEELEDCFDQPLDSSCLLAVIPVDLFIIFNSYGGAGKFSIDEPLPATQDGISSEIVLPLSRRLRFTPDEAYTKVLKRSAPGHLMIKRSLEEFKIKRTCMFARGFLLYEAQRDIHDHYAGILAGNTLVNWPWMGLPEVGGALDNINEEHFDKLTIAAVGHVYSMCNRSKNDTSDIPDSPVTSFLIKRHREKGFKQKLEKRAYKVQVNIMKRDENMTIPESSDSSGRSSNSSYEFGPKLQRIGKFLSKRKPVQIAKLPEPQSIEAVLSSTQIPLGINESNTSDGFIEISYSDFETSSNKKIKNAVLGSSYAIMENSYRTNMKSSRALVFAGNGTPFHKNTEKIDEVEIKSNECSFDTDTQLVMIPSPIGRHSPLCKNTSSDFTESLPDNLQFDEKTCDIIPPKKTGKMTSQKLKMESPKKETPLSSMPEMESINQGIDNDLVLAEKSQTSQSPNDQNRSKPSYEELEKLCKAQQVTILRVNNALSDKEELFQQVSKLLDKHNKSKQKCGMDFTNLECEDDIATMAQLKTLVMVQSMELNGYKDETFPANVLNFCALVAKVGLDEKSMQDSYDLMKSIYQILNHLIENRKTTIVQDRNYLLDLCGTGRDFPFKLKSTNLNEQTDYSKVTRLIQGLMTELKNMTDKFHKLSQMRIGPEYAAQFNTAFGAEVGWNCELLRLFINHQLGTHSQKIIVLTTNTMKFLRLLQVSSAETSDINDLRNFQDFCNNMLKNVENPVELQQFFTLFMNFAGNK